MTTRVRKAVITAAGRGTRQYPATNTVQKELFPLVDVDGYAKPTLQIIVEEALASGVEEVCIVANPANVEPMRRHFRGLSQAQKEGAFRGKDWARALSEALDAMEQRLTFVVQETQDGYGHAVYQAREWVGGEPFVLLLGDHVYVSERPERCARQVVDVFEKQQASVSSVALTPERLISRLGTVAGTPLTDTDPPVYEIREMKEKPTVDYAREHLHTPGLADGEYLCFFGIHAFTNGIFESLEHLIRNDLRDRGEIQLTSAQEVLWKRERYLMAEVAGERFDMGVPEGLVETQIALALRSPFQEQARALFADHSRLLSRELH